MVPSTPDAQPPHGFSADPKIAKQQQMQLELAKQVEEKKLRKKMVSVCDRFPSFDELCRLDFRIQCSNSSSSVYWDSDFCFCAILGCFVSLTT